METTHLDLLTCAIASQLTRRRLARLLGLAGTTFSALVDAKKKRKKKKKVRRNAFGCVNVDGSCRNSGQCCSGICQGKKDKKKCQAHNASTCDGTDGCSGEFVACITDQGVDGNCNVTTGSASYCVTSAVCFDCSKDIDCEPVCGDGAACLICAECVPLGIQTACASAIESGCIPI